MKEHKGIYCVIEGRGEESVSCRHKGYSKGLCYPCVKFMQLHSKEFDLVFLALRKKCCGNGKGRE